MGHEDDRDERRALVALIAAAYRVVETWEAGDLAGRVTALGAVARRWDEALGLGVAGRRDKRDTDGEGRTEDTTDA